MSNLPRNLTAIIRRGETPNINRNVYVTTAGVETWKALKREYPGNYYKTELVRALYSLAITPGGRENGVKTLKIDSAQFHYQILEGGDVLVYGLEIDNSISAPAINQNTGLYRVDIGTPDWKTHSKPRKTIDHSHHWGGAHYAAVSGKFDNKEEAGRLLINHILPAYKAALRSHDFSTSKHHYSLFWQDGNHKKANNARSLAALIQNAQANNASINWLVHGEGAGTFVQALKGLASSPGVTQKVANGNPLSRQAVFFSNPRGVSTSKKDLKQICEDAKIELIDIQLNKHDYKNIDVRKKAVKVMQTPAALLGACGVGTAAGFSDMQQAIGNFFGDPTVIAGISVICLSVSFITRYSSIGRHVQFAVESTLGEGNKHWAA
ncbi:hypothetical protein ACJJIK_14365 [Microbulbifer sp. ZKSA006]|uniref:hypothetical protein n=1 Tax=Microbulbifer sp. ZKSA006 TaxID=3243390 RepID=UPI004039C9E1